MGVWVEQQARVVFSGHCLPGHDPSDVAEIYARYFGVTSKRALDIIDSGLPVTLKSQMALRDAQAMQVQFADLGLDLDLQLLISDECSPFWSEPDRQERPRLDVDERVVREAPECPDEQFEQPQASAPQASTSKADASWTSNDSSSRTDAVADRRDGLAARFRRWAIARWVAIRIVGATAAALVLAAYLTSMMFPDTSASDAIEGDVRAFCEGKARCQAVIRRQAEYCWNTTGMARRYGDWDEVDADVVRTFRQAADVHDYADCFVDRRGFALFPAGTAPLPTAEAGAAQREDETG